MERPSAVEDFCFFVCQKENSISFYDDCADQSSSYQETNMLNRKDSFISLQPLNGKFKYRRRLAVRNFASRFKKLCETSDNTCVFRMDPKRMKIRLQTFAVRRKTIISSAVLNHITIPKSRQMISRYP